MTRPGPGFVINWFLAIFSALNMDFLRVNAIGKKERDFELQDISWTQDKLWRVAIAGETGSGKSTLLKIIGGLVQPDAGEVYFEGERVKGPHERLIPGHRGIAYLSQHFELPNNYWLRDVLNYESKLSGKDTDTLYEIVRIQHLLSRRTNQLSGGEKQRIALTRALISAPRLLLLDEPFSNMDMIHKTVLKSILTDIGERLQTSCILASHDPQDSLSWADEIFVMKEGRIIQRGKPGEVYFRPLSEYVGGLLGAYNLIEPARADPFYALAGIERNGKCLFIRPEKISILRGSRELTGMLDGIVSKVNFLGSAYDVEVQVWGPGANTLIVRSGSGDWAVGDVVGLFLPPEGVWYV